MLIQVSENCVLVDGVNYGATADAIANNVALAPVIAQAALSSGTGFPLAIDRKPDSQVGAALHALPLPPLPEGWTRILAADYADGDEYIDHPAELAEDGTELVPARCEQVASGAVKEHARRAAEWAASQPPAPPAPVPVPQEVTNRAFRLALRAVTGIKPSAVTVALSAIPDDGAREDALSEWEYANTIARSNPLLPAIAAHFGVADSIIDSIFREAAKL